MLVSTGSLWPANAPRPDVIIRSRQEVLAAAVSAQVPKKGANGVRGFEERDMAVCKLGISCECPYTKALVFGLCKRGILRSPILENSQQFERKADVTFMNQPVRTLGCRRICSLGCKLV